MTSNHFDEMMEQSIGNMLNIIIFGISYPEQDPHYGTWRRIQKLRSDGIKELSIAGIFLLKLSK